MILSTLIPYRDWFLCYNSSIGRPNVLLEKSVDEIRRKSQYFINFSMKKIPTQGQVLRPSLIGYKEVCLQISLCRSIVERLVKENKFPQPVKFDGFKKILFYAHEVDLWVSGLWNKGGIK